MKYEKLRQDMIKSMKERDKERKDSISSLLDAIKKIAIDEGHRDEIDDSFVDKIVMKELKSIREMIETCPKDRIETLNAYKRRESVILEYAPKLMSEDEVIKLLNEKYNEVIKTKNKGQIMKEVMTELKGKVDGKLLNKIIEDLCK
ncbi:MAG: GatB/YqeY domain-containing protein [Eubacteriales bacterium]|nr:GatB/YqeY domain-containing protein [Eubacteriales bacterium]